MIIWHAFRSFEICKKKENHQQKPRRVISPHMIQVHSSHRRAIEQSLVSTHTAPESVDPTEIPKKTELKKKCGDVITSFHHSLRRDDVISGNNDVIDQQQVTGPGSIN